jgi:hypothetical protein
MMLMESSEVRARELRRLDLVEDAARERLAVSAIAPRSMVAAPTAWLAWICARSRAASDVVRRSQPAQSRRSARYAD